MITKHTLSYNSLYLARSLCSAEQWIICAFLPGGGPKKCAFILVAVLLKVFLQCLQCPFFKHCWYGCMTCHKMGRRTVSSPYQDLGRRPWCGLWLRPRILWLWLRPPLSFPRGHPLRPPPPFPRNTVGRGPSASSLSYRREDRSGAKTSSLSYAAMALLCDMAASLGLAFPSFLLKRLCFLSWLGTKKGTTCHAWAVGQARSLGWHGPVAC